MPKKYDVLGIGSALMDIQMQVDEATLKMFDFPKGNMSLIDVNKRNKVLDALKSYKKTQAGGGSVANTLANLTKLGSTASMIACVADDEFGVYYKKI